MCVLVIWYMYALCYIECCGVMFAEYLGTYYRLWCCVCAHVRWGWRLMLGETAWAFEQARLT